MNPDAGQSTDPGRDMPDELHPRHLAVRVIEVVAIVAVVAIAITALPGLGEVRHRLDDADPVWIAAVVVAEIASCGGYVLVFRSTFCPQMSWGLSYDISMAELAANSLLPTGGAGGLALGVWALHKAGMGTEHIARRTVAFFLLTSAPNFAGVVVVGLAMFSGILPGDSSPVLTLVPAVIAATVILLVGMSPELLRKFGAPLAQGNEDDLSGRARTGLRKALVAAADGVELAKSLLRARSFGVVVGSFSYMAFDIAALGFAFAAIGPVPPFGVLVLGYLLGQLGNLVPVPGGIGGTEGALVGVFALFHVDVSLAAAAVLIYRLFQLAIPALLGAPAFVALRRKLMREDQPALMCAPLATEVVKLPARS
jgi:uncharacterized protein (TIRG00374 family)